MTASAQIIDLLSQDDWSMTALRCVRRLQLPDWWVVAGFVRGLVWDHLHGYVDKTLPTDIDVVFFDPKSPPQQDQIHEKHLNTLCPNYPWEVCNQAHMHSYNGDSPYSSAVDSFSRWAETVSTIGVTLDDSDQIQIAAPHGIIDLMEMKIRPTPHPDSKLDVFQRRLNEKHWQDIWPHARICC